MVPSHQKPPIFAKIFDRNFMFFLNAFQNLFFSPFGRPRAPKSRRIEFFGPFLAPPRILRGPKNPLRVRLRPARACQSDKANRCSLFLHCTLTSHITLFFLYLFKVGDLQVPCDSSRAEWWGFGTPENQNRFQNPPNVWFQNHFFCSCCFESG